MMRSTQQGFTLLELAITTVIIGVVMTFVSPMLGSLYASKQQAYTEKQRFINQQLADLMLVHARQNTTLGKLPALVTDPYLSNLAIFNPNATTGDEFNFKSLVSQSRLELTAINDDGYSNAHMRKAQIVSGLTQTMPLFFQSGPVVTLTYQMGAIYNTDCTSNSVPSGCSVYGHSAALTTSNYSTWNITAPDFNVITFSTLPLQKQMLAETARRLNRVRDAFTGHYRAKQISASPNDTTNFYSTTGTYSNAGAQSNLDCHSGWQALNAADSTLLAEVGLGKTEFGTTAWGGTVEFCRDISLDGSAADTPPHNAALRIHASVSWASVPDANLTAAAASNNLYLTF